MAGKTKAAKPAKDAAPKKGEAAPDKAEAAAQAEQKNKVDYSVSNGMAARLSNMGAALAFTSYQSNLLYMVGVKPQGGINIHQTAIPRPMGIVHDGQHGLTLVAGPQILEFQNVLNPEEKINNLFDAGFAPRRAHITGALDAHDLGVQKDGRPIFVNTRFNCLARPHHRHSFEEVWRPPFISALVDEDRCHLNGLAMQDGEPKYVSAVSRSDTIDGWRDRRADGGIIMEVATGEVVCEGLSMPHSPRIINGKLWVLNSGSGELGEVVFDKKGKGKFEPRVFCPGFVRGLTIVGKFAFVGLSKPRYKRFEGLALDQKLKDADSEPWCGVQVIDLEKGSCVDWLRIDGAIAELYDLTLISGFRCPMAIAPGTSDAATLITLDKPADAPSNNA
ncbi:MAG: TIGR03032 family protein [Pseudomonadota bacterium]